MFHRRTLCTLAVLAMSCSSGRTTDTVDASTTSVARTAERAIVADLHRNFAMRLDGDKVLDPVVHGGARIFLSPDLVFQC